MDLLHATIPTCEGTYVTLYREPMMNCHVEDPAEPMNDLICVDDKFGDYAILAHSIVPSIQGTTQEEHESMWTMHFDGSHARLGSRAGIVFTYPQGESLCFSYRLEFDYISQRSLMLGPIINTGMLAGNPGYNEQAFRKSVRSGGLH